MIPAPTNLRSMKALIEIVAALRGPDGCPWDKDQTHQSLTPYAIEEVFEFVEAIDSGNDLAITEELGDVLFQVALHAQLAEERKAFTILDVLETLNTKMIRRHPHVFGEDVATSKEEVLSQWEVIKAKEKTTNTATITSKDINPFNIPVDLPALQRAHKIGLKTNKVGFDWNTPAQVKEKLLEELSEIDEALLTIQNQKTNTIESTQHLEEEMGDLLFTVAQYARHLGLEPETCLRKANKKFEGRYSAMQDLCKQNKKEFTTLDFTEKENLWKQVKQKPLPVYQPR